MTDSNDSPPDRLSLDRAALTSRRAAAPRRGNPLQRGRKTNVEEYSVSEGWIKVAAARAGSLSAIPMTIT
jgi:hypothetical protein